jgi:hypothetical protein
MSWATPQDIKDRWVGNDEPTDDNLLEALIADAESVIIAEFPRIQERIDDEELPLTVVVMVVSRMVSRLLRNPDNLTYWQQSTGPFGQARNFGNNNADIWLTDNELGLLSPSVKGKSYSVDVGPYKISPSSWPWKNPGVVDPIWEEQWY